MKNGAIYVAKGAGYLDLAIQSASSLKRHNPNLLVDLYTDQACESDCFDRILPLSDGPTPKLACLPKTRFDRTLYLDCDTIILSGFDDLFDILNQFSLALTHDVRRTSNLIRECGAYQTPYAFPQLNAGVLLYRSTPECFKFLEDWKRHYLQLGRPRDQVSLKDLLWSGNLRFYVLPPEFNLRRVTLLDAWEPLDVRPTIIHSHRLLQHLRGDEMRLREPAEVLLSERQALSDEWQAILSQAVPDDTADPVAKFRIAEHVEHRSCISNGSGASRP